MPAQTTMSWSEWASHDAVGLAELVRKGEVTARELALQVAAGIERFNPELNAVLEIFDDRVGGLDAAWAPDGPLAGVPFPLKDVGAGEKGRLQEWGSRLGQGVRLPFDSFFIEKLRAAGVNFMARTAAPEFGFTFVTESALNGASRNPWDTDFTPGGSSGGAAALTAAGIVPMAHANDGGGSIRLPARNSAPGWPWLRMCRDGTSRRNSR